MNDVISHEAPAPYELSLTSGQPGLGLILSLALTTAQTEKLQQLSASGDNTALTTEIRTILNDPSVEIEFINIECMALTQKKGTEDGGDRDRGEEFNRVFLRSVVNQHNPLSALLRSFKPHEDH